MSNPQNSLLYINFQIFPKGLKNIFWGYISDLLLSCIYLASNHPLSPNWLIYGSHWKSECWNILQIKLFKPNAVIPFTTMNSTSMHKPKAGSTHGDLLREKYKPLTWESYLKFTMFFYLCFF